MDVYNVYGWMTGWMVRRMDEWMFERMDGWTYGWMGG
jgi:hypothetical protein